MDLLQVWDMILKTFLAQVLNNKNSSDKFKGQ